MSLITDRATTDQRAAAPMSHRRWPTFAASGVVVIAGLLALELVQGVAHTVVVLAVTLLGLALWKLAGKGSTLIWWRPDRRDLIAVCARSDLRCR